MSVYQSVIDIRQRFMDNQSPPPERVVMHAFTLDQLNEELERKHRLDLMQREVTTMYPHLLPAYRPYQKLVYGDRIFGMTIEEAL